MNFKRYSQKIYKNLFKWIIITFLFLSCESRDKWTIKKQEYDRTESYNYSEYVSGELDSTEKSQLEGSKQALKQQQKLKTIPNNKKVYDSSSKKTSPPKPNIFDKVWNTISDFIDSILNLF
ncbi:MAG: hypothetical protein QGF36_06150 [Candidatus Marinimicrobia bacterium]|jgi:hypothetical protein|nr:hypothetical protein [Candidatus Neomarinimicrobiota bacterium]